MYTNTHLVKHFLTHGKTRNGNVEMKEICCSPSASIFSWQMDFPVSSTQSLETILDNVIITGLKHEILGEFTLIGIDTNSNQTLQLLRITIKKQRIFILIKSSEFLMKKFVFVLIDIP